MRNSRTSCSRSRTRSASLVVTPGLTPSSTSARLTQDRTDSTPYPSCPATLRTAPCVIPVSACSERTILTAACFSSGEYRRVVGFPAVRSDGMNSVLDFPRPGVSNHPRTVHKAAAGRFGGCPGSEHSRSLTPQPYACPGERRSVVSGSMDSTFPRPGRIRASARAGFAQAPPNVIRRIRKPGSPKMR